MRIKKDWNWFNQPSTSIQSSIRFSENVSYLLPKPSAVSSPQTTKSSPPLPR